MSLLLEAIREQNYERMEALLRQGADVNVADEQGMTPLMAATQANRSDMVRLLLETGADVHATSSGSDYNDWTALYFAATGYDVECARMLLEYGADINAKDAYGRGPVYYAYSAALELLLEQGADPTAEGFDGETALEGAAARGFETAVRIMLAHGKFTSQQLKRAFYAGLTFGRHDIALMKIFVEAGMEVRLSEAILLRDGKKITQCLKGEVSSQELHRALWYAARYSGPRNVRRLLKRGTDPNGLPEQASPPIVSAAQNEIYHLEIIRILLEAGADVNRCDQYGRSALSLGPPFARRVEYIHVLKLLVLSGADVNAVSPYGQTALMNAVWRKSAAETKLLLEAGADASLRNNDGKTAEDYASAHQAEPDECQNHRNRAEIAEILRLLKKAGTHEQPNAE